MLDLLTRMTHAGESMTVRYTRKSDDSVELLIQPALGDDADLVTDEDAMKARAALCRPVLFRGSHADVSECFTRHVQANVDARQQLRDSYDDLTSATKEAAKSAAQAAASKKAKTAASAKAANTDTTATTTKADSTTESQAEATPKADTAPASNPSSLF
ncbi:hypothetical protein [Salinisphaera sp. T31B1]|uniref:hypothetical protein n=1 Tax=Salinisphaera sp. T31B1 TaxID=727963 RepID=UPI00333F5948